MTQLFIKLTFKEKRLFVQAYDCGYFTTLSTEPEIIEKCDHAINQPVNIEEKKDSKIYEVYLATDKLNRKEIEQAIKHLKRHYPDGYVAIAETNHFPNTLYQNVLAALQHQAFILQKKWGVIALNHFGFFNSSSQLPNEVQCQILSHFNVDWHYDHLENSQKTSTLQEDLQLIDSIASFSRKRC